MDQPLEINFRNADRSLAVEQVVGERAEALTRMHDRIMNLRVVIEKVGLHHRKGKLYRTRIDIKLPGKTVVVGRASETNPAHADVYLAVRHAFDAAARRLQDTTRRRRGQVKSHETPPHGKVVKLVPEEHYGFVQLPDGQEVYFHRNSVVGAAFDNLALGDEVRITVHEAESAKGPQAGTVRPVGRMRLAPTRPT